MKPVSFCEQTQVYYFIMHGEVHWIQKEPLTSEEEVLKRRSCFHKLRREMYSTLRLSQALRKACSGVKKQQKNACKALMQRGKIGTRTQSLLLYKTSPVFNFHIPLFTPL